MHELQLKRDPNVELKPGLLTEKFIANVRLNMTIILTYSPVGINLRNQMRNFPALINCCNIDYFHVQFELIYFEIN